MKDSKEKPTMPRVAYPYTRFSTAKQADGDSRRRQEADRERFAKEQGWVIDDSLQLFDAGRSAFKGTHRLIGALSRFLDAIDRGRVLPGEVLIVENIDRLSRENLRIAWKLWERILEAGVSIAVGPPWTVYEPASLEDPLLRTMPLMEMHRAWKESQRKSQHLTEVWGEKQRRLREEGVKLGGKCPGWIAWQDGEYILREPHATALREAAALVRQGHGVGTVCQRFNADLQRYPWGGYFGRWEETRLLRILRGRTVRGELKSRHGPVPGYYPELLTEDEWQGVQAALNSRKQRRGRLSRHADNLFTSLVWGAENGEKCSVGSWFRRNPKDKKRDVYLIDGRGRLLSRYHDFEAAVLNLVSELRPQDIRPEEDQAGAIEGRIAERTKRLVAVDRTLEVLQGQITGAPEDPAILETLVASARKLGEEKASLLKELQTLKLEARTVGTAGLVQAQTILQMYREASPAEKPDLAARLRQELALIVREVWVLRERIEGRRGFLHVRVYLKSGVQRYTKFATGPWKEHHSRAGLVLVDVDLREWRTAGGMKKGKHKKPSDRR